MAAMETWSAPAILAWSITRTIKPESDTRSAMTTTGVSCPLVASSPSTFARTARISTWRPLTSMTPVDSMRIAITSLIFFSSCGSFDGRFSSRPISLTKDVVTMKKISMMKTMSNIGVMLISASSSLLAILRLMPNQSSMSNHQGLGPIDLGAGLFFQPGGEIQPRQRRHETGHRRNRRLRDAARHEPGIARPRECHHIEHRDHARHRAQQSEQRQHGHQRLDEQQVTTALELDLRDDTVAHLVGVPGRRVLPPVPVGLHFAQALGHHEIEIPDPLDDERPHEHRHDQDAVQDVAAHFEEIPDRYECIDERVHLPASDCFAIMPALCSSSTSMSALLRLATTLCNSTSGIATVRPSTVVTSAWEIPPAISFGSPVPNSVIAWKVAIMPVTVPSRPSNGATAAMTLMAPCQVSSFGTSRRMASSSFSSSVSVSASVLSS